MHRMRISIGLLAVVICAITASSASASMVLAKWDFQDNNGVVDYYNGVATTTFAPSTTNLVIANLQAEGQTNTDTTVTPTSRYWQVTVSSAAGINFDQLSFGAKIYSQVGLRNGFVDVRADTNGYSVALPPTPTAINSSSLTPISVSLSGLGTVTSLTVRIYLLDDPNDSAANLTAKIALDNVTFTGDIVPEPTSMALAGFAGIGLAVGAIRRRRNR